MSETEIVRDVSQASLARANEANLAEGLAACARTYGIEVRDESDLLWCATGLPAAEWNGVARAQFTLEAADDRIEWVIAQARTLGIPFLWYVGPSMRPEGLGGRLMCHGFTYVGDEPAMGVALVDLPSTASMPEGVTVERVLEREALDVWVRTMCAGFGVPARAVEQFVSAVQPRDGVDGTTPAVHLYLARLHGRPVATAALTLAAGVAGILAVATVEEARRRGIGTAVTLASLLDARDLGYCVGVLQSTEMGYSIYMRLGFSEQFRYHAYSWHPE